MPDESNDHKQLYHHDTELFMSCESFQNVQSFFANYASIWKHNLLMVLGQALPECMTWYASVNDYRREQVGKLWALTWLGLIAALT